MLKPKFFNIILFLFVKYIVFALVLAVMEDRFKLLVINNSDNKQELISNSFYYLLYVLVFIVAFILVFSAPIYFTFKVKRVIYFVLLMIAILIAEYILYVYLNSQKYLFDNDGIYNAIISILFLLLFFYRYIFRLVR